MNRFTHHRNQNLQRRGQMIHAVGALFGLGVMAIVGAMYFWPGSGAADADTPDLHTVRRGSFDVTIPVTGELVAMQQIEIRNQLQTQAVITEVAAEGTTVNAGDTVLRFNDEELKTRLNETINEVTQTEAAVVAAQTELDVRLNEQESEIAKAQLAVYLADLALKAWVHGEHDSKLRRLKLAVETAQENFDRVKLRYEASEKLFNEKFISADEFRLDRIAKIEAASKLEQAEIDQNLFVEYESRQTEAKKQSDMEQAQGELERTKQRFESRVHSARSDLESKRLQLQSKKDRQRLLEQQVAYCTVVAPSPGLVVYASSMESNMWRWNGEAPRVGSQVWPNQEVIMLPDTSRMAAEVKVSEALSGFIKVGQPATVVADAMPERTFHGEVVRIGVLASSGGWRDPNRRDYTVRIVINDSNGVNLKPAMRCKAEIRTDRVENVIHVPVQAIIRPSGSGMTLVHVPNASNSAGYDQRKVTVSRTSELYAEITEGLNEGERVLLRQPENHEILVRLPSPKKNEGGGNDASTPAAKPAADHTVAATGADVIASNSLGADSAK